MDLLVVAAVELNPSRVALGKGILLVVEDRPGSPDAPVDAAHDDRQACPRSPVKLLVHVKKAVGAGGGKDPAPTVEAEMQTVRAVCSPSTRTYSAFNSPLSMYWDIISASCDWGVIG